MRELRPAESSDFQTQCTQIVNGYAAAFGFTRCREAPSLRADAGDGAEGLTIAAQAWNCAGRINAIIPHVSGPGLEITRLAVSENRATRVNILCGVGQPIVARLEESEWQNGSQERAGKQVSQRTTSSHSGHVHVLIPNQASEPSSLFVTRFRLMEFCPCFSQSWRTSRASGCGTIGEERSPRLSRDWVNARIRTGVDGTAENPVLAIENKAKICRSQPGFRGERHAPGTGAGKHVASRKGNQNSARDLASSRSSHACSFRVRVLPTLRGSRSSRPRDARVVPTLRQSRYGIPVWPVGV